MPEDLSKYDCLEIITPDLLTLHAECFQCIMLTHLHTTEEIYRRNGRPGTMRLGPA